MAKSQVNTVIFDLGGVLIDWNPRYVYRTIFKTEEEIDWFFQNICTSDWNENQDAGYSIAKATEEKIAEHPDWENEIRAYYGRWTEMLGKQIDGTVEILRELKDSGRIKLFALTNWSAETFPIALERFEFLKWFDGIVVSGEEKTRKPFAEIYTTLLRRYAIDPSKALFIDDSERNIKGAETHGIKGLVFTDPKTLRSELKKMIDF